MAAPKDGVSRGATPAESKSSGDRPGVGHHIPSPPAARSGGRLSPSLIAGLREIPSISSEVADLLNQWGWATVGRDSSIAHRVGPKPMVGQAVTLSYLPERELAAAGPIGHLAHHTAASVGHPGDVLVISTHGVLDASVLGGQGAMALAARGLVGAVVDGAMRDLDEVRAAGISAWARSVIPQSGVGRLEAVGIDGPVLCAGVQVHPGDLVVADESGVVFIPEELVDRVAAQLLGPLAPRSG